MPNLDVAGCRRLAVAVLRQAVKDVADARLPTAHREQARAFLQGAGYLELWAHLAGVPAVLISRRYPLRDGQMKPTPVVPPKARPAPRRARRQATAADSWLDPPDSPGFLD